ncbi:hypothetical protein Krac_3619 [Ktedonobacter racemifer DSM 44963]|uniref:Uncharacterized protein n=1 Tax=Ktedonobacter racemifer DSM 44963 TaxID=485913 RepID=D6U2A1_KTERA|nr:hypothetical protein Krac_3619 [Ktedonobacter racemifer DSM 44963]
MAPRFKRTVSIRKNKEKIYILFSTSLLLFFSIFLRPYKACLLKHKKKRDIPGPGMSLSQIAISKRIWSQCTISLKPGFRAKESETTAIISLPRSISMEVGVKMESGRWKKQLPEAYHSAQGRFYALTSMYVYVIIRIQMNAYEVNGTSQARKKEPTHSAPGFSKSPARLSRKVIGYYGTSDRTRTQVNNINPRTSSR